METVALSPLYFRDGFDVFVIIETCGRNYRNKLDVGRERVSCYLNCKVMKLVSLVNMKISFYSDSCKVGRGCLFFFPGGCGVFV